MPGLRNESRRVHSRYERRLADLPMAGKPVRLVVAARRFFCDAVACGRRIFAERFDMSVLAPWARRTSRLDDIVHHLGLALGGRPAASFARRLMMPVSNDTLLRAVRRRERPRFVPPDGDRDRRLGVAAQPALRHPHLRSGETQDHSPPAGPRGRNGRGLAVGAAPDRHRRPRPGRRVRPGRRQSSAQGDSGRRSLASDGERQPRLPGRGAQIDARAS